MSRHRRLFQERARHQHRTEHAPAFLHSVRVPSAHVVFNVPITAVDFCPVGVTHIQEVRPQSAYRILGDVGQGLTGGRTKQKRPDGFVNSGYVVIPDKGIRVQEVTVDRQGFSDNYLKRKQKNSMLKQQPGTLNKV